MNPKSLLICTLFCVMAAGLVLAQDSDIESLMAQGAASAKVFDYESAAVAYTKVIKLDPNHYEATWKAGDMYTELADHLDEKQKSQKETYFNKAEELCLKAVTLNPDGWEGHFKLSVVYGRLGLFRGGKEKVKIAQLVRAEAEKALVLNPQADKAMHVLGRWHMNVAALSSVLKFFAKSLYGEELKGTWEEAADWFNKAIALNPGHIEHHYQLALTYKELRDKPHMKTSLEQVLALPSVEEDDDHLKSEAEKLLKSL